MDRFTSLHQRQILEKIAAADGPAKYPRMMDDVMKQLERAGLIERHSNGNVLCAFITPKGRSALGQA